MTDRLDRLERHLDDVLAGPRRLMRSLSKTTTGKPKMTTRTDYPFPAWRMLPSGKLQEVTAIKAPSWDRHGTSVETGRGLWIKRVDLFDNRADCIAAGEKKLVDRAEKLSAQMENVAKAIATLEKSK